MFRQGLKRFGAMLLAGGLASCASTPAVVAPSASPPVSSMTDVQKTKAESYTITIDGIERSYILYLPSNLKAGAPLLFVIHGFTDNAPNMMLSTKMNQVADANGFAVVYPQGTKDDQGRTFWEVGYEFTVKYQRNDVKFLVALAHQLQKTYGLSKTNTFVSGMSNGAEMSIVLGFFAPETFHAIAAVSGCILKKTAETISSAPTVPAFFISGDTDSTTWWGGDMENKDGWGAYLPVLSMIDMFTQQDAGLVKTEADLPDSNKNDQSRVHASTWTNESTGRKVVFFRVLGGGHDWPGASGNKDIDASSEIWQFFRQYIK